MHNRPSRAGSTFVEGEREAFHTAGLATAKGVKTLDFLKVLNHATKVGTCRGLLAFRPPSFLRPLETTQVRQRRSDGHWVRTNTLTGIEERELLEDLLPSHKVPVLHLTIDQASWGWAAAHFLAELPSSSGGGMGLMVSFVGDEFHRIWNDFLSAARSSTGSFMVSVVEMIVVYNLNYGPWLGAAFLHKKKEALLELVASGAWKELSAEWCSAAAAEDARKLCPNSSEEELSQFCEVVLQNSDFRKKGPYVKMCPLLSNVISSQLLWVAFHCQVSAA